MHGSKISPNHDPSGIDSRYDHLKTEEKIYRQWESSGFFNPDNLPAHHAASHKSTADSFSIMMPPPNANGSLHLGHAVGVTLQDIMIRYARMRGKKTLWLPGADHAGFETQVVFDKKLDKEGRNRFAMDRDELWKEIWEFTQTNKKVMEAQLRKLGASCDWSRETFTLDPKIIAVVYDTFGKLYKDGLVYRDLRVVNWCPKHQTALSDLEVKYVEREDPLYYIKYGPLTLATVRPETKFGDTALAVNPHDKRYQDYIGKEIEANGVLGPLKFKVIADDAVDPKFGTGVVKVTPAHDQTDFEIWTRHKKDIPGPKQIIDERGRLTGEVGDYRGLKVAEARVKISHAMQELGIIEKIEPNYKHNVATCYKCGNTLEPLPKPQWFIKMETLAKPAIEAVKKNKIKFFPERTKKTYFHWLENIRDWNISRQIVWGIRIPAYFCLGCGGVKVNPEIKSRWYLVRHGDTPANAAGRNNPDDEPLSEAGVAQVEATATALKDKQIGLIISSHLTRARQTAEIIARVTHAEIVFDETLRERHFGIATGMERAERDRLYGHQLYTSDDAPPGGESFKEMESRAWSTFRKHKSTHRHKNIVIVSHAGPLRAIVKNLRDLGMEFLIDTSHAQKLASSIELAMINDSCKKCGGDVYEQDPDVFDTWFSSGQWPFATLMANEKKMGFHEEVVPQVLDGKTKTYRLRDHGFKVGDKVLFENSATKKIFGYGIMTEVEQTTIDKIDYQDKTHYKTYKNLGELMAAFKHKNPEKSFTAKSTAYLYAYKFYPTKNPVSDFKTFYPTSVMETGYDILFFWVARMIMLGLYRTGEIPFREVYLHGLVRDKDRQKMSKSKGNVIDPLGVAAEYGTDAVRMALVVGNTAGNDIVISEDKIRGYRNFSTKIWNIARFILMNDPKKDTEMRAGEMQKKPTPLTAGDKKIIADAKKAKERVATHIESRDFHLAAETAYHYIWHTFADKIVENAKPRLESKNEATRLAAYRMLTESFTECLKMLHPFMPYISEELFQKFHPQRLLMTTKW